jgi:4-methyl-5(b-hydroxyethyl)-thiazole monophosphate biosynthesis
MMNKSFLFLADGFEEVEAVTTIDVARRGGVGLVTVSIHPGRLAVTGAHGVTVTADTTLDKVAGSDAACLIFPGGMPGAENLGNCPALIDWLQLHAERGRVVAAICAAPAMVLSKLRVSRPSRLTCYPGYEGYLAGHEVIHEEVVIDGNFITARGPACAVAFGLAIVESLHGSARARGVAEGMLVP